MISDWTQFYYINGDYIPNDSHQRFIALFISLEWYYLPKSTDPQYRHPSSQSRRLYIHTDWPEKHRDDNNDDSDVLTVLNLQY